MHGTERRPAGEAPTSGSGASGRMRPDAPERGRTRVILAVAAVLAGLAVADFIAPGLSLTAFYLLPIFLATWYLGRPVGLAVGGFSALVRFLAELTEEGYGLDGFAVYWNGVTRVLVFAAVVMLVAALRASHLNEQRTIARLHALNDLKDTLLHAVSHDLKGPMTVVLGSVRTIRHARAGGGSPADEDELLSMIETSGNKMVRLITDLLDLDRLDRGLLEPDRRPVDLAELTAGVVADIPSDSTRTIEQDLEPTPVSIDPSKVERIVDNLMRNAIAHTPIGTPIHVRVRPLEEGALLVVEDEGDGVADELKHVIFEPFAQGGSVPLGTGAGIGLSLVARFAALHGGRAWVTDRPGGGASFRVYLPGPLADADMPTDPPSTTAPASRGERPHARTA